MKVISPVVNNPEFIKIQHYTLKKYMQCDYEFIIFNDAKEFPDFTNDNDITVSSNIQDTCDELGIRCIKVDNNSHKLNKSAMYRCSDTYNFILQYQKQNPDKYLTLDSDMFLIDYFNPVDFYSNYSCSVVLQNRTGNEYESGICNYIWNGIFYFDMNKLSNQEFLDWNPIRGTDVGGSMWKWLKMQTDKVFPTSEQIRYKNPTLSGFGDLHLIKHLWSLTWNLDELTDNLKNNKSIIEFLVNDPRNSRGNFFCEIYDNRFFHYRAGGNWNGEGMKLHKKLSNKLLNALCD